MFDEVVGEFFQPGIGGDDFVVLAQQLFHKGLLIWLQFGGFDCFADLVVQVRLAMLRASPTVLIHELDRCPVLLAAFEVVAGNVIAKIRLVSWSPSNSGVPVKPMKAALGSAIRMLRASLPAWVRWASSEMTMMSSRSL